MVTPGAYAQTASAPRWRFFIDRGGTFTDLVGISPETNTIRHAKVLSSDEAPLLGIRSLMGLAPNAPIPPCDVRLGTTLATNALLERRGRECALLISEGFQDLLEVGNGARPDLFELNVVKSSQLYSEVVDLAARLDARGQVLKAPDEARTKAALERLLEQGIRSVAIVVMHSYLDDSLERRVAGWATELGFDHVVCSAEAARELGLLRRAQTTVLDAYLTPVLAEYLRTLGEQLPGSSLLLMQSSGRLASAAQLRGPASLLSGPAGGVVAYARLAELAGEPSAIGFDMGGTSTDVSRVSGELPRVYECTTAGVRVVAPMMDIHTVAAGGGSICAFDGHTLSVGPHSAGADPGPLCYGNLAAVSLTVTDVNLLLGRLQADRFPFPLVRAPAERALTQLHAEVRSTGSALTIDEVATGLLEIANDNMARAISKVSVARGHDVRRDALVVFGGAGGQHACAVARKLGIRRLLFPPLGGLLSAVGMGLARRGAHAAAQFGPHSLDVRTLGHARERYDELERECVAQLDRVDPSAIHLEQWIDLRYQGTDVPLTLRFAPEDNLRPRFDDAHAQRFGYSRADQLLETVALRVEASAAEDPALARLLSEGDTQMSSSSPPEPVRHQRIYCDGWRDEVPVFHRRDLQAGQVITGPACIIENAGTIVVDPGFCGEVMPSNMLRLTMEEPTSDASVVRGEASDPVALEIVGNAFMSIAEQMGAALARTATSTNIRERLDFSCAVFDRQAQLIANAPHIPVHLGAMGESVRAIAERFPNPTPGDVFVTNDPACGGSHLPDITVVTPVFSKDELVYFVANRGHHADVGGITPGSMPPISSNLAEEGVTIRPMRIVHQGKFDEDLVRQALASGPYPARHPDRNVADLQAQVAANQVGSQLTTRLIAANDGPRLLAVVAELQSLAASKVEHMLRQRPDMCVRFSDCLDDGTPIAVELHLQGGRMRVTFAPTPEHPGNANTPRAVVISAVLYVLRCLVGPGIPLNSGCLRPVEIITTPGTLTEPGPSRAVCSGNVETSQRIVDVLLGALGAAAASQGTMNNLTFGNANFSYYETLAGGMGAGPDFHGASGLQVHMTNTRMTDPEVLEAHYPVRLLSFRLLRGTGGAGKFHGGDGIERSLEFLTAVHVAIVSERRTAGPFGLAGGLSGARGANILNGKLLAGRCQFSARAGDVLNILTPGGGGFGPPVI